MKTMKEFSKPENVIQKKSAVYYLVQGKKPGRFHQSENDNFETVFFHKSPIKAREQAFSFYQNYISFLRNNHFFKEWPLTSPITGLNTNFGGETLQKYSNATITYRNPDLFNKGVAIYMVVEKPISHQGKADKKGDRFLIHGIWNFNESDVVNLIEGLQQEIRYYKNFKYDTKQYVETLNLSSYPIRKSICSIISTPFDWQFNYFLNEKKAAAAENQKFKIYKDQIADGSLQKNAFEFHLDKKKLVRILASFSNTDGGLFFYGMDEFRRPEDVFKNVKPTMFKSEMQLLIRQKLPSIADNIDLDFIQFRGSTVAVFSIKSGGKNILYVAENNIRKLYIRDAHGEKQIKNREKIFEYIRSKEEEHAKMIQKIIDIL
jgi:hypothetical protein